MKINYTNCTAKPVIELLGGQRVEPQLVCQSLSIIVIGDWNQVNPQILPSFQIYNSTTYDIKANYNSAMLPQQFFANQELMATFSTSSEFSTI